MTVSNARSTIGLSARVTPTSPNSSGTIQIGSNDETTRFADADNVYSLQAVFCDPSGLDELAINLFDNDTTGSTTFVAGTAQVETATAVGTITTAGNATVVVTGAGITGSPVTLSVAVALNDTAAVWAGKVRTALAANAAISALYTISGASASIVLTRKPSATFTVPGGTLNCFPANDSTLNISLDNGTCAGITTAATSAKTTAGVLTAGVKIYGGDEDFEGNAVVPINYIKGIQFETVSGDVAYTDSASFSGRLIGASKEQKEIDLTNSELDIITFTSAERTKLNITVIGEV